MSFPTWTNALKIPTDEDITWNHRPSASNPNSTDPATWEWRRDRRITFQADVAMAALYEADWYSYLASGSLEEPVFRFYDEASDTHKNVRYTGTWVIDNVSVRHTGQGGKSIVAVTLVNISDAEYQWAVRS